MKKLKNILTGLFILQVLVLSSQTLNNSEIEKMVTLPEPDAESIPNPNICDNALSLCPKRSLNYTFKPEDCQNGVSRLYFEFESAFTGTSNNFFNYIVSGSSSSSYKVYGPFSDSDNSCDMINSYQAQILVQNIGNISTYTQLSFPLISGKKYVVEVLVNSCNANVSVNDLSPSNRAIVNCGANEINECEDCLPKFLPSNDVYVISAWVKDESAAINTTNYINPQIIVSTNMNVFPAFTPTGQIIDGWQRIEGTFQTSNIQSIGVELKALGGVCYFDDIRIFPANGSMMSYVYDPISLRLLAELDERNYAKFYEYDEEGKLIRIKKETEKGIMTIQENRDNNAVR